MEAEKKSIYIESTIPGYAASRPNRDIILAAHQTSTKLFWETERGKYDFCISQDVIDECSRGDREAARKRLDWLRGIRLLPKTREVVDLAEVYQKLLDIPDRAKADCVHLAICVIEKIDYLLSWNCTHLGPASQAKIQDYNKQHKLWTPLLVTPDHLLPNQEVLL
jgi:hypothetical protein